MVLPAEGRRGRTPKWPLDPATAAEQHLWGELWHTPQAVAWEALGWNRVVARYARVVLKAEELQKDAMAEARQLEDRLGLSPKAMRLLLWTIGPGETDVRPRLELVDDERWRRAGGGEEG